MVVMRNFRQKMSKKKLSKDREGNDEASEGGGLYSHLSHTFCRPLRIGNVLLTAARRCFTAEYGRTLALQGEVEGGLFRIATQEKCIRNNLRDECGVQGSAKRCALGCVIPTSWPPLTAGAQFTQPRAHLLADPCRCVRLEKRRVRPTSNSHQGASSSSSIAFTLFTRSTI